MESDGLKNAFKRYQNGIIRVCREIITHDETFKITIDIDAISGKFILIRAHDYCNNLTHEFTITERSKLCG